MGSSGLTGSGYGSGVFQAEARAENSKWPSGSEDVSKGDGGENTAARCWGDLNVFLKTMGSSQRVRKWQRD